MKSKRLKHPCVLAIAPSYRGFGFAVFDGDTLVAWGVKVVTGDKNVQCLLKVNHLITCHRPDFLALEDYDCKRVRRGSRIRHLVREIIRQASNHQVKAKLFTRQEAYQRLCAGGGGTKDELAEAVVKRFPKDLNLRLPPKRRLWKTEDYRMAIFDAVAFGLMAREN